MVREFLRLVEVQRFVELGFAPIIVDVLLEDLPGLILRHWRTPGKSMRSAAAQSGKYRLLYGAESTINRHADPATHAARRSSTAWSFRNPSNRVPSRRLWRRATRLDRLFQHLAEFRGVLVAVNRYGMLYGDRDEFVF